MSRFKNKKIAIVGLSVEGMDTVKFLTREGAHVTCVDRRTREQLGTSYETLSTMVHSFQLGTNSLSVLHSFDIIVRTPGMSLRTPELVAAKKHGAEITSLTKLFFETCRAPIVGVTGTKGKGTTSTLIYEMLRASGKKVWLGGNVGTPLLSKVHEIVPSDIVVLELSSFQLEDLTLSPHVAVVLKITQEHLANFDPLATNFHESREAYVEAKKSIVKFQKKNDIAICNADDPTSISFAQASPGQLYYFSRSGDPNAQAYVQDNAVFFKMDGEVQKICDANEISLIGIHNLENIATATLAAYCCDVKIDIIRKTVRAFKGLEHRLELVRTLDRVSYYNDSFSTIPETTIAAIDSFTQPLVLVVGGSEKGSDFTDLGKRIAGSRVHTLIVIGTMTARILKAITDAGYKGNVIQGLESMPEIVAMCKKTAKPGDIVILSPACASFDMFKNYKERGRQFKYEVQRLS